MSIEFRKPIVIAIDGAAATGKSSVATTVAGKLNLAYFNTGAMYRALTWWCDQHGITAEDAPRVAVAARNLELEMNLNPHAQDFRIEGTLRNSEIRSDAVTRLVSGFAGIPSVRECFIQTQRQVIASACIEYGGVIADGRDVTSVVAPDADVRLLLIANDAVRVARRTRNASTSDNQDSIRDQQDSQVADFMRARSDVDVIDTTFLSLHATVQEVLRLITLRAPEERSGNSEKTL